MNDAGRNDTPAGDDSRDVEGSDVTPDALRSTPVTPRRWLCDLCGATMRESHCKLICDQCGYIRDCSDP